MKTQIIIFEEISDELKNIWLEFEKKSNSHCFQSFFWVNHVINLFKKKNSFFLLQIILVKKNDELVSIFPLYIKKKFGLHILCWIGDSFSDYNTPLISNTFDYKKDDFLHDFSIIKKKIKKIDIIYFERQSSFILNQKNPFFFFLKNFNISKNYRINIATFNNLKEKNINEFLFLHFDHHDNFKEYLKKIINLKIFQLNKKYFIKKNYTNLKFFYDRIDEVKSQFLKIYVSVLKYQEQELSCNIGILYKKCFYYLVPTYNSNFKKFSPGKLLIKKILEWCIQNRISFFDFGQGDEKYKKNLANENNFIGHYYYINSLRGSLFYFFLILKKVNSLLRS